MIYKRDIFQVISKKIEKGNLYIISELFTIVQNMEVPAADVTIVEKGRAVFLIFCSKYNFVNA